METFYLAGELSAPSAIPDHDAVRCLGTGAHGQVWLMSPHNGSPAIAAKFLSSHHDADAAESHIAISRHNESHVTQEWRVASRFRHDHLLAAHGLIKDADGGDVLLMEYAAGGSLAHIITARGPLTVGEAITILTPMGQVLAYLHGQGAVHGDVSPGNIMLSAAGKPLLADFGTGRLLGQEVATATGTKGFYAITDSHRNAAADIYALAAVGWYALTGRVPPPTSERLPLSTFVPHVPAELLAALEAGLSEEAADRPTAAAFAQAVFRSAVAEPVALGNAVHPSVLPELLTLHEPVVRGRRKADPVVSTRIRDRLEPFLSWPRSLAASLRIRRTADLGALWGSGREKHLRHKYWIALVAVMLSLAVIVVIGVSRSWLGMGSLPLAHSPQQGVATESSSTAEMNWASALPQEIQEGMQSVEPVVALHALAWVRAYAVSHANQAFIEEINVPDSLALDADLAIIHELATRGHTLSGFTTELQNARISSSQGDAPEEGGTHDEALPEPGATAVIQTTVATSSFVEVDGAGLLIHRQNDEQIQELQVELAFVGERWRIQQILGAAKQ